MMGNVKFFFTKNYKLVLIFIGTAFLLSILLKENYVNYRSADAYHKRGIAYFRMGDYEKAITAFNKAIRLDSSNVDAYFRRGSMYYAIGNHERALVDFNEVIRLDPYNAEAYSRRSLMYYDQGDYNQSLADINEAIRLDSNYHDAYFMRILTSAKKDNGSNVKIHIATPLTSISPNLPEILDDPTLGPALMKKVREWQLEKARKRAEE